MSKFIFIPFVIAAFASAPPKPRPYIVDSQGNPTVSVPRSLCGPDDMVPMVSASGSFQQLGTPIGILNIQMGSSTGKCSGTLISKNLFLTAQHCEADCEKMDVTFGYLSRGRAEKFKCKKIIEKGNDLYENDYMIFELEGNPGIGWGWYPVSDRALSKNHELLIIHHPLGTPMKVSRDCYLTEQTDKFLNHRCDTQPGSSGSAIIAPDYARPENARIVGVHTLGGCNASETSFNSGPSMRHLVSISPLLKSMSKGQK